MAEANGIVTADAKAAFVRSVTLDNTTVSARYYLGIAAEQDGDRAKAAKIFRDLIAEAPADAHWVSDVRTALARVEGKAPAAPAGPTPAQMAAAAKEPPAQQDTMIKGMVEGLAARLKADGSDLDGWVRLVRSYKVLGEQDKMKSAIADAQRALAGDPDKRRRLDDAIKALEAGKEAPVTRSSLRLLRPLQPVCRASPTSGRADPRHGRSAGRPLAKIRQRSGRLDHAHALVFDSGRKTKGRGSRRLGTRSLGGRSDQADAVQPSAPTFQNRRNCKLGAVRARARFSSSGRRAHPTRTMR